MKPEVLPTNCQLTSDLAASTGCRPWPDRPWRTSSPPTCRPAAVSTLVAGPNDLALMFRPTSSGTVLGASPCFTPSSSSSPGLPARAPPIPCRSAALTE